MTDDQLYRLVIGTIYLLHRERGDWTTSSTIALYAGIDFDVCIIKLREAQHLGVLKVLRPAPGLILWALTEAAQPAGAPPAPRRSDRAR